MDSFALIIFWWNPFNTISVSYPVRCLSVVIVFFLVYWPCGWTQMSENPSSPCLWECCPKYFCFEIPPQVTKTQQSLNKPADLRKNCAVYLWVMVKKKPLEYNESVVCSFFKEKTLESMTSLSVFADLPTKIIQHVWSTSLKTKRQWNEWHLIRNEWQICKMCDNEWMSNKPIKFRTKMSRNTCTKKLAGMVFQPLANQEIIE